jgi:hypothetical protein
MREYIISSLILLFLPPVPGQVTPAGWQTIKDPRNACQLNVPADWTPYADHQGAAVFRNSETALAIVTSQPGQVYTALPESVVNVLGIPPAKLFENSATRIFYQDRTSTSPIDHNSYSFTIPAKVGTCSGLLTFLPSVSEETARTIVRSLAPVLAVPSN